MNIWHWYEQYEHDAWQSNHSTRLFNDFFGSVIGVQYNEVEALLPEVHAQVNAENNPWLGVLLGHWEMRHRLCNKGEGQTALADVVALYERAHQSDAAECPQSVCVTQDLSNCYCNVDARGWADERIAVCQETIERIDATWSCYQCLTTEQAEAMLDKGLYEEALNFVRQQIANVEAADTDDDGKALYDVEAQALMMLGRYDEALALMNTLCDSSLIIGSENVQARQINEMIRLQIMARAGRDDEVWKALPEVTPLIAMRWADIVSILAARAPEKNTWHIGRALKQILEQRVQAGAPRNAITVAKAHITLALARNATWAARQALELARTQLPKLRSALGDDQALAELAKEIENQSSQASLPVAADQLMAWLDARDSSERDPEQEVEWLMLALNERPDDKPLRQLTASALQACAADEQAIELLQSYAEQHLDEESEIPFQLLHILLQNGRFNQIERLADLYAPHSSTITYWFRIQLAQAQEDWEKVEQQCREMLQQPDYEHRIMPHLLAGEAAMKLKAFDRSLHYYMNALTYIDQQQEMKPESALWCAITAASALKDWDLVRTLGTRLGMTFSTEKGPIAENYGWIRLRFSENSENHDYLAQRTGPVTATVLQPSYHQNGTQHLYDEVVFEPSLLNEPPQTEEEQQQFIELYEVIQVQASGGYAAAWFIDGPAPQPDVFQQFIEQLENEGCNVWVTSEEDYEVVDTQNDYNAIPAQHFLLSAPVTMTTQALDTLLTRVTAEWPHQPHWLGLARKAGVDDSRHLDTIERYQL